MLKPLFIVLLGMALLTLAAVAQGVEEADNGLALSTAGRSADGLGDSLINSFSYPFSVMSGTGLEDMTSGTTQIIAARSDEVSSPLTGIGFTFRFDGVNYTTFAAHSNGLLTLGQVWTGVGIQNQTSLETLPKLMPYWDDLCVGPSGKVHYKVLGSPGSRKLVIEWLNIEIARSGVDCSTAGPGTFQLWMFEQTGQVQFVYGNGMTQVVTRGGYSVGLHVGGATNFASVTTAGSSVSYTIANDTQIASIPDGRSFVFSPPVPSAPSGGNITMLAQTSLRLNWTDNAGNETGYEVRRSTDGVNYSLIGTYPADTTDAGDSGLTPSTQYFYKVNAVTAGAFSDDLVLSATTNPSRTINSTGSGGMWSAPSTWVGGNVPDGGDNVTIVAGATVIIDTAALAGSITVGGPGNLVETKGRSGEGANPAILRFGETATYTLTVAGDVLIGPNDSLTTGGGSANQHVLSVGGDIVNNGTLDLSTNNGAAGATINFNGSEGAALTGIGPVTDVFLITVNKPRDVIVDLSSSNFTVAGSAADTSLSGYLIVFSGTFKISGTFSGTHRTFPSATYSIPPDGGLWLNNPNYTIAGQAGIASVFGSLRVSAGTYNVGVGIDHSLRLREGSNTLMEGGSINTAAMFTTFVPGGQAPLYLTQTGGTITSCTAGSTSTAGCFAWGGSGINGPVGNLSGGKIIIQNPATANRTTDYICQSCTVANDFVVQFGNQSSLQPSLFKAPSNIPKLVINTSAGGHRVQMTGFVHTVEIGSGGILEVSNGFLSVMGESFVNNGFIKADIGTPNTGIIFYGLITEYSGSGSTLGAVGRVDFRGVMFNNVAEGMFRVREMRLIKGDLLGANKFILGNNDSIVSNIVFGEGLTGNAGSFDTAPQFELGTGGQSVFYGSDTLERVTGPEINPDRALIQFSFSGTANETLTIAGGQLTVGVLSLGQGKVIATGANSILHYGNLSAGSGYVTGTIVRKFTNTNLYVYPLGVHRRTATAFVPAALGTNPVYVAIGTAPVPMPGLVPSTSIQQYWTMSVSGEVIGSVDFNWTDQVVSGNEENYKLWRSTDGGEPLLQPFGINTPANFISTGNREAFNGNWGVGEGVASAPVSVSGAVRTAGGMPIRNALIRITGPGLTTPLEAFTGNLGNYIIDGLRAGETYTVQVGAKRYRFNPSSQMVTPSGNMTGIDFTANPQK